MTATEGPGRITIPDGVLARLVESRRIEAEINSITTQLSAIEDYKRDPASKANGWVSSLLQRRADLVKQPRIAVAGNNNLLARPVDRFLLDYLSLFGPWISGILPFTSEGVHVTPGVQGTSGDIVTAGLFAGGLGYGGTPTDDGTHSPNIEKWWVHNWNCSYVFPPAPYTGTLYYRFTVDSDCTIYDAPAQSGVVQEFVTIGKSGDVLTTSPFDSSVMETVGWPVMVNLPQSSVAQFSGSVPVSGSIPVTQGKTAALAFVYGAIVGVASGFVQFSWANFGTRKTLSSGAVIGAEAYDKIEYRFEPNWWITAVQQRLFEQA
jgi:hypothetical protein